MAFPGSDHTSTNIRERISFQIFLVEKLEKISVSLLQHPKSLSKANSKRFNSNFNDLFERLYHPGISQIQEENSATGIIYTNSYDTCFRLSPPT